MARSDLVAKAIVDVLASRSAELEDTNLRALTLVVKFDARTGRPGAILWRPEAELPCPK